MQKLRLVFSLSDDKSVVAGIGRRVFSFSFLRFSLKLTTDGPIIALIYVKLLK